MKFHINNSNIYDIFGYTEDKVDPDAFYKKIKGKRFSIKQIIQHFGQIIKDKNLRKEDPTIEKEDQKEARKEQRERVKGVKGVYRKKDQLKGMADIKRDYRKQVEEIKVNRSSKKETIPEDNTSKYLFDKMMKHEYFYIDTYQLYFEINNLKDQDDYLRASALTYFNNYIDNNSDTKGKEDEDSDNQDVKNEAFASFFSELKTSNGKILFDNFKEYFENENPANPQRVYEDFMATLYSNDLSARHRDVYDLHKKRRREIVGNILKGLKVDYKLLLGKDDNTDKSAKSIYDIAYALQKDWNSLDQGNQKEKLYKLYEDLGGKMNASEFSTNFDEGNIKLSDVLKRVVPKEMIKNNKIIHPDQVYYDFIKGVAKNASEELKDKLGVTEFMDNHSFLINSSKNLALILLNSLEGSGNLSSFNNIASLLEGVDFELTLFKKEWEKATADGRKKIDFEVRASSDKVINAGEGNFSDYGLSKQPDGTTLNWSAKFRRDILRYLDGEEVKISSYEIGTYFQNNWVSGNTTDPQDISFTDIIRPMLRENTFLLDHDLNEFSDGTLPTLLGIRDYYSRRHDSQFDRTSFGFDLGAERNFYLRDSILKLSAKGAYQFNKYKGNLPEDESPSSQSLQTNVQTHVVTGDFGAELLFNNGLGIDIGYTVSSSNFQGQALANDEVQEELTQTSNVITQKAKMEVTYQGIKGLINFGRNENTTHIDFRLGTDLNKFFSNQIEPGKYEVELQYSYTQLNQKQSLMMPSNSISIIGLRLIRRF